MFVQGIQVQLHRSGLKKELYTCTLTELRNGITEALAYLGYSLDNTSHSYIVSFIKHTDTEEVNQLIHQLPNYLA